MGQPQLYSMGGRTMKMTPSEQNLDRLLRERITMAEEFYPTIIKIVNEWIDSETTAPEIRGGKK